MRLRDRYGQILQTFPDAPERFELTVKDVYSAVLREGETAMDLGAHTGKHSLPMGRVVGAAGRVYAFEPILEKFKVLANNVQRAGLFQVTPLNACCLDETKIVTFVYLPTDPGKSAIHIRKSAEAVEKVYQQSLAVRLDDLFGLEVSPQFIKIDIEGAELAAMRGAQELIGRARPVLHIEIGTPSLDAFGVRPEAIYSFLDDADYALTDVLGHPLADMAAYLESIAATGVYDYFAVPRNDPRQAAVIETCKRVWQNELGFA